MALTDAQKDAQLAAANSPFAPNATPAQVEARAPLDVSYVQSYASPFSTAFGGTAQAGPNTYLPPSAPFTAAGVVNTAFGPVQVDSTGRAADGSMPIAASAAYTGTTTGATTSKVTTPPATSSTSLSPDQRDAYALLIDQFTAWGIPELATYFKNQMSNNIGPNQAALDVRNTPEYINRFKGNEARIAAGLNALTPADYVAMENEYTTLFTQYGLSSMASKAEAASLIGKDISKVELNARLDLAVNKVANADPNIKAQLKAYYPGITDADLTQYFLKPDETLPKLQQKVTAAEIGAAATQAGLSAPSMTRAEELAAFGVDQAAARTGYEKVATVLPETQKLASIYGETGIKYGQQQAESEFLTNDANVARQRRQLSQLEQATFAGQSGVSRTPGESLTKLTQGKF